MSAWLAESLAAFTLLLLLVLALRRPVVHFCGANWAYALWAIPALRLLLPPLPALPSNIAIPSVTIIPVASGVAAPLPALAGGTLWVPLLLGIWALGAATFLIAHCLSYRAFLARVAAARPGDPPSYGGIDAVESAAVEGPLALGLLRRRIVLPADFARRYSADERRFALEHELVHHRRGDIWWNLVALAILALNWFNPVAWLAYRAFRRDQELACDAAVTARISRAERHDYAVALVKSASAPGLVAACPLNRAGELKHRLSMMAGHRVTAVRRAGGAVAMLILAGVGLVSGLAAPAAEAPVAAIAPVLAMAPVAREMAAAAPVRSEPAKPIHRATLSSPRKQTTAIVVEPVETPALALAEQAPPPPSPDAAVVPLQRITITRVAGNRSGRVLVVREAAAVVQRADVQQAIARALTALDRDEIIHGAEAREALRKALQELRDQQPESLEREMTRIHVTS